MSPFFMMLGDKAKKEVIPSFLFLLPFIDTPRATVIQYSYNKNKKTEVVI
jgi:hypothetical protein